MVVDFWSDQAPLLHIRSMSDREPRLIRERTPLVSAAVDRWWRVALSRCTRHRFTDITGKRYAHLTPLTKFQSNVSHQRYWLTLHFIVPKAPSNSRGHFFARVSTSASAPEQRGPCERSDKNERSKLGAIKKRITIASSIVSKCIQRIVEFIGILANEEKYGDTVEETELPPLRRIYRSQEPMLSLPASVSFEIPGRRLNRG